MDPHIEKWNRIVPQQVDEFRQDRKQLLAVPIGTDTGPDDSYVIEQLKRHEVSFSNGIICIYDTVTGAVNEITPEAAPLIYGLLSAFLEASREGK